MAYEAHWVMHSTERGPKMMYSNPSMLNISRKKNSKDIYYEKLNYHATFFRKYCEVKSETNNLAAYEAQNRKENFTKKFFLSNF